MLITLLPFQALSVFVLVLRFALFREIFSLRRSGCQLLFGAVIPKDWRKKPFRASISFDPGEGIHALIANETFELVITWEAGRRRRVIVLGIHLVISASLHRHWCILRNSRKSVTLGRLGMIDCCGDGAFCCGCLEPFWS